MRSNASKLGLTRTASLVATLAGFALLLGLGCWPGGYVYYEDDEYGDLDYLRPEIVTVYGSFLHPDFDHDRINEVNRRFDQMYEHEREIGRTRQAEHIDRMRQMFRNDVNDRTEHGQSNQGDHDRSYGRMNSEFNRARRHGNH